MSYASFLGGYSSRAADFSVIWAAGSMINGKRRLG